MTASRSHLLLMIVWVLLAIPTVLWWRDSVLWVAIMSLYANFSTHWGAFQAARAEEAAKE